MIDQSMPPMDRDHQSTSAQFEQVRRPLYLMALLLFVMAGSPGCREQSQASKAPKAAKKVLVLGAIREPDRLDPLFTSVSATREPLGALYRDLTRYDSDWTLHPDLAAKLPKMVRTSTHGLHYRWELRPNLRWSDGRRLTTADVRFGHNFESNPKNKAPGQDFASGAQITTSSSSTQFEVTWRRARLAALAPRNHAVLPEHSYGIGQTGTATSVYSGPYVMDEWVRGQYLRLKRNVNFYGQSPYFDEIVWRFIGNEDAMEAFLKTGEIHAIGESGGLSVEKATALEKRLSKTHAFHYTPSGVWLHLDLQLKHPGLAKQKVRKAINLAIDKTVLAKISYAGKAKPAESCFPDLHPGHRKRPLTGFDLKKATALIKAAQLSPVEREIELKYASESQSALRSVTYIQAQLAKIGLNVSLKARPFRVLFADMRGGLLTGMSLYAWRSGPSWDGRSVFHTKGAQNFTGFTDPRIDVLYKQLESSAGKKAFEILGQIEERYLDLLPVIPLLFRQSASVRSRKLLNWRPTGTQTPVTWNAEVWRWAEP